MNIYTIGFTKKSAQNFFSSLKATEVKRLLDVRLNNTSQLAGFAKKDDLRYFTKQICDLEYVHVSELAPTAEILNAYKKKREDWEVYERLFLSLMQERRIEETVDPALFDGACLLCSEHEPHHCHRRLVAEYLQHKWPKVSITHLV